MAFGKGKALAAIESDRLPVQRGPIRSLVASALRVHFDDASYNNWRFGDETWQRELWRLFDITPEFAFASRWVGNCCSQVRIYVAKVDKLGRVQGEATKPKVAALGDTIFGGPAAKAQNLRSLGINLTVSGEAYIVGQTTETRDEWLILSSSEIRRIKTSNGEWNYCWGPKNNPVVLDLTKQLVTRVWTPHPQRVMCADSPARSCQPVLRELEQLTKYVFSQIDSRLIGAGLLIIPNNLDFPLEDNTATAGESLMVRLATAGAASLRGEGSALGVLPHIIEAAPEDVERGFKLMTFESELSKQAMDLRKEAIERLGVGMDMPPEVLKGMGEGTSHWSAWLVDGQGIKIHIEPLMTRICDALNKAYLYPALKQLGEEPGDYSFAYDTSPLIVRPTRFQDALNLYEKGGISAQALRHEGYFKESDAPDEKEQARRLAQEILLRDPQLVQNQAFRELAGIPEGLVSQESMVMPTPGGGMGQSGMPGMMGPSGPPPPPPPPTGIRNPLPPPIPDTLGDVANGTPAVANGPPTGIQASAKELTGNEMALIVLAEATVRRGLELAGKRLLDRHNRDRWPDVPHFELHTRIKVADTAHANRLLGGAWDQLSALTELLGSNVDPSRLRQSLTKYCSILLTQGVPHEPPNLLAMLQAEGLVG